MIRWLGGTAGAAVALALAGCVVAPEQPVGGVYPGVYDSGSGVYGSPVYGTTEIYGGAGYGGPVYRSPLPSGSL